MRLEGGKKRSHPQEDLEAECARQQLQIIAYIKALRLEFFGLSQGLKENRCGFPQGKEADR